MLHRAYKEQAENLHKQTKYHGQYKNVKTSHRHFEILEKVLPICTKD